MAGNIVFTISLLTKNSFTDHTDFASVPSTSKKREHDENVDSPIPSKKITVLQDITIPATSDTRTPSTVECREVQQSFQSSVETQTTKVISSHTPRMLKLKKKIVVLQAENKKLKKELEEVVEPSEEHFFQLAEKYLTPEIARFIRAQVNLNKTNKFGRRYTEEFKRFALTIYFLGPRCYIYLQSIFLLPSTRSLSSFVEKIKFSAGYNKVLFDILKLKVQHMNSQDRFCTICIDEMSIKTNLFYNYASDEVIGLEDNGSTKSVIPASSAAVLMVCGLKAKWKQPIAYVLSSTGYDANDMKSLLDIIVKELANVGLKVVGLVSDMGSNVLELAEGLGVTQNNSKIILGGQQMFYFFDACHLIKAVRNNLLMNEFAWEDKSTSWKYIELFYGKDKSMMNRLAPKLTKSHLEPTNFEKMKVKLATQVISNTVAASLETYVHLKELPETAMATVELIAKFDKLFDIFNSSTLSSPKKFNNPFKGDTYQLNFLKEMKIYLQQLKVYKGLKRIKVKFINCWIISINSLIGLWELLQSEGFSFLFTRKITQDSLENFFGRIRQQSGNAINPTPIQFTRAFRKLFILNYIHSKSMNCEKDFGVFLTSLSDFNFQNSNNDLLMDNQIKCDSQNVENFRIEKCDYQEKPLPEQNAFKYVAGYLIHQCLKIHSCPTCEHFSRENDDCDESNLFIHLKAYDNDEHVFGGLKNPDETFYHFIYILEKIFFLNIEKCITNSPANHIFNLYKSIPKFNHPCENFPYVYLMKLFLRLRIYYVMKKSNSNFRTVPKKNRKLSILMNL